MRCNASVIQVAKDDLASEDANHMFVCPGGAERARHWGLRISWWEQREVGACYPLSASGRPGTEPSGWCSVFWEAMGQVYTSDETIDPGS